MEKFFQEGDQHGVGNLMKTIWFTDKEQQKKNSHRIKLRMVLDLCSSIVLLFPAQG